MNKLLMVHTTQYGYHTNALRHCQYLSNEYQICYVCLKEEGRERIEPFKNVSIVYVPSVFKSKKATYALFLLIVLFKLATVKSKVLVYYFRGCKWLKMLFPHKKMILDIRTLGVSADESSNCLFNQVLLNSALKYDFITFLSDSIRKKIDYPKNNYAIVPLGADIISSVKKDYSSLHLLYVGIFNNRCLETTLMGVKLFVDKYPDREISYTIIGSGSHDVVDFLTNEVKRLSLTDIVSFTGPVPHFELEPYFSSSNIGVSFVPLTSYYDSQPVTKTFEYAMSGLFVIATATTENKRVISGDNGVLIKDDAISFCDALEKYYNKRFSLDECKIRESLQRYLWKEIVYNDLKPIINRF